MAVSAWPHDFEFALAHTLVWVLTKATQTLPFVLTLSTTTKKEKEKKSKDKNSTILNPT